MTENKEWNSGNQTAGWGHTLNLPGDAAGVRILGEAKTGLVWNPWGEIMNVTENGPTNKCYKATGTTLNASGKNWTAAESIRVKALFSGECYV